MEKPIITSLSARGQNNLETLTKQVKSSYLERTFSDITNYLLSNKKDDLNDEYSASQVETCTTLTRWKQRMENNQGRTSLYFKNNNDQLTEVGLEDVIGDYSSQLLQEEERDISSSPVNFKSIDLIMDYTPAGGN